MIMTYESLLKKTSRGNNMDSYSVPEIFIDPPVLKFILDVTFEVGRNLIAGLLNSKFNLTK